MASRAAVRPSPSEPPVSGLPQVHLQSPLPCLCGVCPATRRSVMLRSPMRGSVNPQNGNPSWRLDRPIPQLSRSMDFANSLITLVILPYQPYPMHIAAAKFVRRLKGTGTSFSPWRSPSGGDASSESELQLVRNVRAFEHGTDALCSRPSLTSSSMGGTPSRTSWDPRGELHFRRLPASPRPGFASWPGSRAQVR